MSAFGSDAQRRRLAAELKRLRVRADLSGRELAQRMEAAQSTVSKVETGEQKRVPVGLIVRWARATGAPEERLAELLELNEQIQVGPQSWNAASEMGSTDFSRETAGLEARTGVLSNYRPAAFPGLLQTPAYASRLLSSGPAGAPADLAQRAMGRIERQRVLYDESKRFRFVIPEAVLRWPYGPPDDPAVLDEQREQLARIEWATGRPNIVVGILPLAPTAVWRTSGFVIFDEVDGDQPQVHLELLTRPVNITEPDQVEMYRQAFENLLAASVIGDDARRLITTAAGTLNQPGNPDGQWRTRSPSSSQP
jgi:transcriptional regulator with XRE-family HTH domain